MLDPHASAKFYDALPMRFKDNFLLTRALTHRSYLNENRSVLEDNERLEFLGDSILGYVVAEWLYNNFSEKKEGVLTKLRSALVHTSSLLISRGDKFRLCDAARTGEDQRRPRSQRDPVRCFEALIAAIYLDTDITTVKEFLYPFLKSEINTILANHSEEDVKSLLQEWAQAQGFPSPVYLLTGEFGPDHEKVFAVKVLINDEEIAEGIGGSKQLAEKSAAGAAILKIGLKEK